MTIEMIEELIRGQIYSQIRSLPPLPPGWVYEINYGEPHYNPETDAFVVTMEAKPIQKYIIKED